MNNGNNEFVLNLLALLDEQKSKSQINANIKELEQSVRKIKLVATLAKGNAKSELNQVIKQLESQLKQIKLQAKIDSRQLNRDIDNALRNVSARDIQLNISSNGERVNAQVRRVVSQAREFVQRNPISMNIDLKKEKLLNQLTTFTNKHTKINESSYWLGEAERLRGVIGSVTNRDELRNATDQLQVFTSGVRATGYAAVSTTDRIKGMLGNIVKVGNYFGLAYVAVNKFRQSLSTLKENDTILTEISKTSEMTKQQLKELGDEAFNVASKYGQLSGNYLLGVQEMARSGYESLSKELGELSLLAQSAGDMTAEMANNYLLATDAAYKYGGSVDKLNAALDGANYISNKNSASLTDIADATRVSASFAANANVAIDELTAAEATMIAVTKRSGSEIGRAFRSILLNLQQVSGEFDGEVIDETQLKKVEETCHNLGVELEYVKDGVATLRDPMEVLKELSEVYNSLPDNSAEKQELVSSLGGKYHANSLTALLSRWDLYEKMLSEFSQGTGSALEEANKTADSWAGRLAQLSNSWTEFVNSLTNKDAIKGGISFLDNTIQAFEKLTDTIGALPVILTTLQAGMSAFNKNYGITQIYNKDAHKFDIQGNFMGIDITAFKNQKKHFHEAEIAMATWNNRLVDGTADIENFGLSVVQNNEQLKAYLRTTSADAPASLSGYRSFLNAAGVSTDALRLKTILMTSALTFGLSFGIQKTIELFSKWANASKVAKENAEEFTASLKETQNTQNTNTSAISGLSEEYADLSSKVDALGGNLHLTSEEYARYHDITNQVANIMPSLIQGYDAQGNAILKLKGKLVDLNAEYDKYKQNEAIKNYNEEDKDGNKKADSVFKNYRNSKKANISLSSYFSHFFDSQNELTTNALSDVDLLSYLEELYQMSPEDLLKTRKSVGGGTHGSIIRAILDTYGLDSDSTETEIETVRQNISTKIMSLTTDIENQVLGIGQTAITYAQQSSTYWKDLEDEQRVYISSLFNNLTPDIVDSLNLSEKGSMEAFVNNMVLSLRENKDGINDAFNELFTFEPDTSDLTPDEIKKKIDDIVGGIAKTLNTDQDLLKDVLGIDYDAIDSLSNDYLAVIEKTANKFKDTDKQDLEKFFKENSINTQEEIDRWQEIAEAAKTAAEAKEQYLTGGVEIKSFSQRFKDLWDSESFSDTKEELQKLAKEAGITEDDLYSLARENEELASLLTESGISAQFAATCFNRVCDGADGFSAITEDARALDQVLHGMDESLQSVAASKFAYDKAMKQDDYNSDFENYQEAYKSAMEMFENGDYGKHFRSAMEYLLGDKSYTMSIEEMYDAVKNLKNVFGEDATNGLEFLDKLYAKKDILDSMDSSLKKLSDGSYDFDLKPDDFEAIGEAIGMTADEVAACTNALGMFGNYHSYDLEELENTLNGISIAAKDGEKSILSLQGVESILSDLGYNGYEIYHILEDIKDMGSLEILDFNASDGDALQSVINKLSELDMLKINGDSIDVSGLADKLKDTFGMTIEDIQTFLASLGKSFDFTDSMGTDVVDAYSNIQDKIKSIQAEIASGSYSADEIVQMQAQLEELKRRADALREPVDIKLTSNIDQTKEKLEEVTRKYDELKASIASKQEQGITVTYGDTNALNELANQKAALEEQLNHYNELKVTVDVEREQADADINDLTSDKETNLTVNIANKGEVDAQFSQWMQPKSTTLRVDVTANDPNGLLKGGTSTAGQTGSSGTDNSSAPVSGTGKALGNAQFGHSFADGTIGAPKTETALINELGNETIIDPQSGTYEIVEGGAQFRKIKKGQIILNHLQTKALQKYGKISSFGKMLFGGNAKLKGSAYPGGNAGGINPATKKPYQGNNSTKKSQSNSDSPSHAAKEAKEATEEFFDWIERRIKKFQALFDKWIKQAETAVTSGFINKYYKKATSAIKNELSTYGKAYKRYMKQADSIGLSKKYRDKVKDGTIDIETIKDEKLAEQIKKYQEYYDKAQESTTSFVETAEKLYNLPLDKAATKIEKFSDSIDLLDKKLDNAVGAKSKNKLIDKQTKEEKKTLDAYKDANKETKSALKSAKKELSKSKNLNADDGITKKEKKKIKDAIKSGKEVDLSYFKVGSAGYNAAVKYNEALKANTQSTYDLKSAQEDYKSWLSEASVQKFENVQTDYEHKLHEFEQRAQEIDNKISLNEEKGYLASSVYYDKLIANEQQNNAKLIKERDALVKSLNDSVSSGNLKEYSDDWYDLKEKIDAVTNAVDESAVSIQNFMNTMRQIKWDRFDTIQSKVSDLLEDVKFSINELSRTELVSDKVGGFTDNGKSVAALHVSDYETYRVQAADYAREIRNINNEIASNPYDTKLIDRKRELVKAYEDCISGAQEEKYAVIDLYKQAYDSLLNKIRELISEYEELLDAEKSAYDYQQSIAEKIKDIADIRKQLTAYSGDLSEEARAKIQKLEVDLKEAEKSLQEAQYERYISDTKDMFDDLEDTLSDEINDLILALADNFDRLIENINVYSKDAMDNVNDYLSKIGFDTSSSISNVGILISNAINSGTDISRATYTTVDEIKNLMEKMQQYVDSIANGRNASSGTNEQQPLVSSEEQRRQSIATDMASLQSQLESLYKQKTDAENEYNNKIDKAKENSAKYKDKAKKEKDSKKKKEYEAKKKDYDSMAKTLEKEKNGVVNSISNNISSLEQELQKLEILLNTNMHISTPKYAKGSKSIPYDQWAITQEKGPELIRTASGELLTPLKKGDMVFTNEMSENLWKLAQVDPSTLWNVKPPIVTMPEVTRNMENNVNVQMGDIVMNGVNDPEAFGQQLRNEICKNGKSTKCMAVAIGAHFQGKGIGNARLYR